MADREFHIVLFGATGFVGSLTAEQLAVAHPGIRVALAGRSMARLEHLRAGLGAEASGWTLVVVDAADPAGLRRLASRTTVLATTVGPYARYGQEVVRACAEVGTHYADLTGELLFVRWSLDTVAVRARETGARIVHSCGFDSIPSDLGVWLTAQRAAADGQGTLTATTLVVRSLRGGISGGTIDSARAQAIMARDDPGLRSLLRDPYALSPARADEPVPQREPEGVRGCLRRLAPATREPGSGRWLGPFVMADYNERLVRLSNALTGWSYGRELRYREASDLGSGTLAPVVAAGMVLGLGVLTAGLSWAPSRLLLDRALPRPGEGPSAEQRARGRFRLEIDAVTTTGARYRTTVAADHDPGYDGTAVMLAQSALSLALDGPRLPHRSGVLTPATAMGGVLADRLRARGFTLAVERVRSA